MKKEKLLLLLLIIAIGLTGCLREGMETIALPFGKIPQGVIPDAIREQFEEFMPIYEGYNPPDITGKYLAKPLVLVYTSDGQFNPGHQFADQYLAFQKLSASGAATYAERQGSGVSEAPEVYVVGSGNNFTAYFVSTTTRYDEYGEATSTSKMSTVLSGTITDNGIEDYHFAFVMLEKDDPYHELMDENEYRIFEDGDGLAVRYEWSKSPIDGDKLLSTTARNDNNQKMK